MTPEGQIKKQIADSIIKGRFGIRVEDILAEAATPSAVVQKATDQLRRKVIEREKAARAETEALPLPDPAEEAKKIIESISTKRAKKVAP